MTMTTKGVLTAGLLAAFQLVLFAALFIPQAAIIREENEAERSAHLGNILSHFTVNMLQMAADTFNGRRVTQTALDEAKANREALDSRKSMFTENEQGLIGDVRRGQMQIIALSQKAQAMVASGTFAGDNMTRIKAAVKECCTPLSKNAKRLTNIVRSRDQLINNAMQQQAQSRKFSEGVLLAALIFEALLAVMTFWWFKTSIAGRLSTISENARRLVEQNSLLPRVAGEDEIADLDRAFHRMSDILKKSAADRRALVDNSRDLIFQMDGAMAITAINAAVTPMLRQEPESLVGRNIVTLIGSASKDQVLQYLESCRLRPQQQPLETMLARKGGGQVEALLSAHWSKNQSSYFCVLHDNSIKRATDRLKREIVQMVNHDVRTPLFTVSSFLEMAGEDFFGKFTPEGQAAVKNASDGTQRMLALAEDLLTMEKMASGSAEMHVEPMPLQAVLEECLAAVEDKTKDKRIKTQKRVVDVILNADLGRIRNAMYRLALPLVILTPREGSFAIKCKSDDKFLKIELIVAGQGPPQPSLEALLDPYKEAETDLSAAVPSRLSLCVARSAMQMHKGDIAAVSGPESYGFVVTLPMSITQPK